MHAPSTPPAVYVISLTPGLLVRIKVHPNERRMRIYPDTSEVRTKLPPKFRPFYLKMVRQIYKLVISFMRFMKMVKFIGSFNLNRCNFLVIHVQ
jgi:hypothetical protein